MSQRKIDICWRRKSREMRKRRRNTDSYYSDGIIDNEKYVKVDVARAVILWFFSSFSFLFGECVRTWKCAQRPQKIWNELCNFVTFSCAFFLSLSSLVSTVVVCSSVFIVLLKFVVWFNVFSNFFFLSFFFTSLFLILFIVCCLRHYILLILKSFDGVAFRCHQTAPAPDIWNRY